MTVKRLLDPSEAQLDQAGRCWAEGIYPTNPLSRRMVGHSKDISRRRAIGIIRREESYVAYSKDADEREPSSITGVMVIQRPKGSRPAVKWASLGSVREEEAEEIRRDDSGANSTPSNQTLGVLIPPEDQEWINTTMKDWWVGFSNEFFGPQGNDNRLYLTVLSVLPDCQNQGLGRQMMDVAMEIADENGWESSLATSGDEEHIAPLLRFYKRYGFEVVGHSDLDSGTEGVCRTWAMIRPAKSKQDI